MKGYYQSQCIDVKRSYNTKTEMKRHRGEKET